MSFLSDLADTLQWLVVFAAIGVAATAGLSVWAVWWVVKWIF
ncbi:hypothetical protein [Chryseobacterium sp.]